MSTQWKYVVHAPHLTNLPLASNGGVLVGRPIKVNFSVQEKTPSTWDELHRRALAHKGGNDLAWLLEYTTRIAGNCECRKHWILLIQRLPPDFTRYFEWTVEAHNDVNRRLNKPELTVEEARAIWSLPPNVDTPPKLQPPE